MAASAGHCWIEGTNPMPFCIEARLRRALLAAALCLPLVAGCQSPMPNSQQPSSDYVAPRPQVTWSFDRHSFGAYCYNTIGCKVLYANFYEVKDDENEVAPPPEGPGIQRYWHGGHGGIENFPPPAVVAWRSLDGAAHEAHVDIGEIFKNQQVIHNVPAEKLAWNAKRTGMNPDIILVVDDRTVSVYMRATVVLKEPEIPGNQYSNTKSEFILAWQHAY